MLQRVLSLMLFAALGMCSKVAARDLTITTRAEGDLYDQLQEMLYGEKIDDITRLTVIGPVGLQDCLFILFKNLVELDLSQAVMPSFGGANGLANLQRCALPESTKEIQYGAFYGCKSLTEVVMPAVEIVGMQAFSYCSSLKELHFPSTISSADNIFLDCSSLTDVYVPAFVPLADLFYGTNDWTALPILTLHVPQSSADAWREAYGDNDHIVVVGEDIAVSNIELVDALVLRDLRGLDGASVRLTRTEGKVYYNRWTNGALTVDAGNATWHLKRFDMAVDSHTFTDRYAEGYSDYLGRTYAGMTRLLVEGTKVEADEILLRVEESGNSYDYSCWTYFSLPFDARLSDADCGKSAYVVRRFDAARRASQQDDPWVNVGKDELLRAHEGYILMRDHRDYYDDDDDDALRYDDDGYDDDFENEYTPFVFRAAATAAKQDIFRSGDAVVPLEKHPSSSVYAANWNFVSNPYGCYYDIASMTEPVVLTVRNSEGKYEALSTLDDDYKLAPFMPFFVQSGNGIDALHLKASGRSTEEYLMHDSYYSHRRELPYFDGDLRDLSDRHVLNLFLSDETHTDRARIVANGAASEDYEINRDALKFMSDNPECPQVYVEDCGVQLAIDERPLCDGLFPLGVRIGRAGEYTFSMPSAPMSAVLIDHVKGTYTDLTTDAYRFTAGCGDLRGRFTLAVGDAATKVQQMRFEGTSEAPAYDLSGRRVHSQPTTNAAAGEGRVVITKNKKKIF